MRIYDISVPISAATPTYPGDPGVEIKQWTAIADGYAANVSLLHFGAHTATHVDAPAHFIDAITPIHITALDLEGATRVLFKTRNSAFWSNMTTGFRQDFTYIAPDAARALVELGVRLVGIDYLSVEKFQTERHETQEILLSNNIVIIEGLDLREVSAGSYELVCLPLKIAGGTGDGAPARAVLRA